MPHEQPPAAGHHYHHERTTVKEVEDDFDCPGGDSCNTPSHAHYARHAHIHGDHAHHAPGIAAKLKNFLLGPAGDEYIVEKDIKVTHVHHDASGTHKEGKHWHGEEHYPTRDAVRERKHAAREAAHELEKKAHDKKERAKQYADHLVDEAEEGAERVKAKAEGPLSSIWSSLENARAKLDNALYGTEQKVGSAARKADRLKTEGRHKLESTKAHVYDESGRRIDHAREKARESKEAVERKAGEYKDAAEAKYEEARLRAKHDAERIRARVNEGADSVVEEGEHVASRAQNAAEHASRKVSSNIAKATDRAKQVKDDVKRRVDDVREDVRDGANQAADRARQAKEDVRRRVGDVRDDVRDSASQAAERARQTKENVKHRIDETRNDFNDKVRDVKHGVKQTADEVKQGVRHGINSAKESVEDGIHAVEHGAESVYHKFEGAAECLGCTGPRTQGMHVGHGHAHGGHHLGAQPWDSRHNADAFNPVPVTAFYTGLSCLWFIWLARRVWMARNRSKVYLGDGSHELAHELHRDVVVSETSVAADGRAARTTATLHTVNRPAVVKLAHLLRSVEARTAFAAVTPLYLILLAALELAGAYRPLLHILSLAFLVGNVLQSEYGVFGRNGMGPGRPVGTAIQWAVLASGSIMAIYLALSCKGCPVA
ncbi:hypothetical protein HDU87_007067 [Geranomyces variabilis]|uniref:Uncharacterized protein n=1 Tax=Geranomyces variabilis TaxID=109894 RepID=A0AAD5TEH1_9FUNG|nr:hypothetical protein HDU87_007067 [Geranomyces variabilis]